MIQEQYKPVVLLLWKKLNADVENCSFLLEASSGM